MSSPTERDRVMTFRLDPTGIVRLTWVTGSRITGELARAAMNQLDEFNAGRRRPMLVDMVGVRGLTREGRMVFTQPCSASSIALLGGSPVDRVIANFALGVSAMPIPMRYFTSEPDAVAWLRDVDPGT